MSSWQAANNIIAIIPAKNIVLFLCFLILRKHLSKLFKSVSLKAFNRLGNFANELRMCMECHIVKI